MTERYHLPRLPTVERDQVELEVEGEVVIRVVEPLDLLQQALLLHYDCKVHIY
jgi:hypothetical protein